MLGEDTTRIEISPSWRCMRGPYLRARSRRARYGSEPAIAS